MASEAYAECGPVAGVVGTPPIHRRPVTKDSRTPLIYIGTPALALEGFAWRISRAVLLYRAGSAALKHGSEDPQGKAGLEIVNALTSDDEPWYSKILGRKPDDG